ncbi:hypothetical protein NPX13_g7389 [Xylaria arbuscula]|uniref:Uncharacterized protein n=1 Tax=Xylaria arbuscula TaxID=114810 RepID=A0A9W8NAS9_9PEZI|nr:hypothetical protein NPX13_g7389 [Xylaria arbuscula]
MGWDRSRAIISIASLSGPVAFLGFLGLSCPELLLVSEPGAPDDAQVVMIGAGVFAPVADDLYYVHSSLDWRLTVCRKGAVMPLCGGKEFTPGG